MKRLRETLVKLKKLAAKHKYKPGDKVKLVSNQMPAVILAQRRYKGKLGYWIWTPMAIRLGDGETRYTDSYYGYFEEGLQSAEFELGPKTQARLNAEIARLATL